MNRLTRIFFTFLSISIFAAAGFSQAVTPKAPEAANYEIVLQVLVGTDTRTTGGQLPQSLTSVTRQLKANYTFSGLRLANTYVGRISNGGSFEFKSVSNLFGSDAATDRPSFLDWSLSGLKVETKDGNKTEVGLQGFRFGARVPIITTQVKDNEGKMQAIYNYENVGLSSTRIAIAENVPTLLGSLSLPNSDSSMFLILTLRPA